MAVNESILSKLESSRKELLDLGLRNSLLNYKLPAGRGLHIVREKSSAIYDILVRQGKAMSFTGRSVREEGEPEVSVPEPDEQELEEAYSDTRLQTNETETVLLKKLLDTYYAARTSLEEQGVNILYISLGILHWCESESSEEDRLAPLLLIPVTLERSSVKERFRVKYTLEEIGGNVSLQEKMKHEFGILLEDLPEPEDFDIGAYFDGIGKGVENLPRWRVEKDAVELGFFSFGKFMLYSDLDNSRWPWGKKPSDHPLLQNLFEGGFRQEPSLFDEKTFIDNDTIASELFQVVDADSSQILAMLAVREGKNLVIQGPPGTGKSQTITNLIADAIGQGKKVLFVAEKMAALEVVKRRLDSIGMGEACLELHSHKANKKEMHQELMRVLELGRPDLQKLQQEVALLEDFKGELNGYCLAVNTPVGKSSLSPHTVIGRLLQLADQTEGEVLRKVQGIDFARWDTEKISRVEAFADRIQARLKTTGVPDQMLFWGAGLTVLMPAGQEELVQVLQNCQQAIQTVRDAGETAALRLGIPVPAERQGVHQVAGVCHAVSLQPDLRGINIKTDAWLLNQKDIEELLETGKRLAELHTSYAGILLPEAWDYEVMEIRQELLAHGDKWYRFAIGSYNRASKQLAALCKMPPPKETAARLQYVDDILEAKRLANQLAAYGPLAGDLFGRKWQQAKSDWTALEAAYTYLAGIHQQIVEKKIPGEVLDYLSKLEDPALARKEATELVNALFAHQQQLDRLLHLLSFDELKRFPVRLLNHSFTAQLSLVSGWLAQHAEVYHALTWNTLVETAVAEKLEFLIHLAESWPQAKDLLKAAVQKSWYEYLLQQALITLPALNRFQRDSHEEVVQQFRKLDRLNLQYNRGRAASKHWENVPRTDAGGQVNILKREFNKKARHKPIRKLIEEAGLAVQAIKPVFMMSPLSIANFLPPGSVEFDLVIFDEASQVKPVDALGAILRAKQLVVVGDTKQLPPTSFFDSLARDADDEENVTADMQSILGLCQSQGLIPKMLRWHYRSRHESLITLSNHEFYENKLVVFPSPGSKHRMGLVYHPLKTTFYDRGKTRTNPQEAETVADAVIEHARKYPGLTLGVVAFSSAQRQAIQDALEVRRRVHADAEPYFRSHPHEPFFIKNLENVQGDERDVIFISIGYGRTEEGYVAMSFGPLNNEGGERRLNVLITRAKLRCEVFTNISANDIDLARTKSYGIRALKNFLHFAQYGKLNMTEETALPFDSPFEENVFDQLTKRGYIVRNQIGSQGFYIDLAVVDPANPGRYIIGIECDGAAYHSARSARDRDRLRQQVLENIGWKIHRVWSTDWYRNPGRELKRMEEAIDKAASLLLLDDEALQDAAGEPPQATLQRDQQEKKGIKIPLYETARLVPETIQKELHLYPVGKLLNWIEEVVKVESPVHFDEMAKRIAEAGGITKVGSRIRETLAQAVSHLQAGRRIKVSGDFLWAHNMEKPTVRNRSNLPGSSRKLKLISPQEMRLALEEVVQNAIAISSGDAAVMVSRMFGFTRVTEEIKKELLEIINKAVESKYIQLEGGLLKTGQP